MIARDVLAGIKARAEAATPGPWEAMCSDSGHSKYELDCSVITSDIGDSICDLEGLDRVTLNERYKGEGDRDAYFIAAARSDVPRLVAAVEAVLDLHRPYGGEDSEDDYCDMDGSEWPCTVVRAITAALEAT
jgi:hypothetical protein